MNQSRLIVAFCICSSLAGATLVARGAPTSVLWTNQFGGAGDDAAYGVAANPLGEAIVAGSQQQFLPSGGYYTQASATLFDAAGQAKWSVSYGEERQYSVAESGAFDSSGNVIVGGRVGRPLGGGFYSSDTQDIFLAKYDSQGNKLWSVVDTFGQSGIISQLQSLDVAQDGSIYGAGTRAFGGYIARWTPAGQLSWLHQLPRSVFITEAITAIDYVDDGAIYISGFSRENLDNEDAIVARFDASGKQVWNKRLSLDSATTATDLAADEFGNIYVSGITGDSLLPPENDSFVAKLDTNGQVVWSNRFGEAGYDLAMVVETLSDGRALVGGISGGAFSGDRMTAAMYVAVANSSTGELEEVRQVGPDVSSNLFGIVTRDELDAAWLVGRTHGGLGRDNLGQGDAFLMKLGVPEPGCLTCALAGLVLLWSFGGRQRSAIAE